MCYVLCGFEHSKVIASLNRIIKSIQQIALIQCGKKHRTCAEHRMCRRSTKTHDMVLKTQFTNSLVHQQTWLFAKGISCWIFRLIKNVPGLELLAQGNLRRCILSDRTPDNRNETSDVCGSRTICATRSAQLIVCALVPIEGGIGSLIINSSYMWEAWLGTFALGIAFCGDFAPMHVRMNGGCFYDQ